MNMSLEIHKDLIWILGSTWLDIGFLTVQICMDLGVQAV